MNKLKQVVFAVLGFFLFALNMLAVVALIWGHSGIKIGESISLFFAGLLCLLWFIVLFRKPSGK
jgi:hypothetical protein